MRQIGQELGVAYLLEGSVRRAGNTVRVTGQLIDARTEAHLWANKYDRDLRDIFSIQSELAQAIAAELKATLTPAEKKLFERRPTDNTAAYDLFLKARENRNTSGVGVTALQKQERLLQNAADLDPNFAVAWAELAFVDSRIYKVTMDNSPVLAQKAKAALDTAVRLAPDAPETIRALGEYAGDVRADNAEAVNRFEQLVRLQPNNADARWTLGVAQRESGEWAAAATNLRLATQLEPASLAYGWDLAGLLRAGHRYDEAITVHRRLLVLQPGNEKIAHALAMLTFEASGSTKEMDELVAGMPADSSDRLAWARTRGDFAEAIRLDRADPRSRSDDPSLNQISRVAEAALTLAAAGDRASARARLGNAPEKCRAQLLLTPENRRFWSWLGIMEAIRGNNDEARRCAHRAVEINSESVTRFGNPTNRLGEVWVLAWTGDKDGAIAELAQLFRTPFSWEWSVYHAKYGPWLEPLKGDPRFEALLNDPRNNAPLF
jgi:tetratricopeptide (TPR) repeat protein